MAYPTERFFHCFQIELEFGVLVFMERRKPENPEKNTRSRNENQQQTQPTYGTQQKSNPGHMSERRALSPLPHPCAIPAPSLRHPCPIPAPSLRHPCAIPAPSLPHPCPIPAPSLRHPCAIPAPSLLPCHTYWVCFPFL